MARPGAGAFGRGAGVGRVGARRVAARPGQGGVVFGDHGVEAPGEFFELADGRAASRREHGVLAGVFGEGCDQERDDRGERLAQGGGGGGVHS